jgi:hypothetical protein
MSWYVLVSSGLRLAISAKVFLRSVLRLLATADVVTSSPIPGTLMTEAILPSTSSQSVSVASCC